MCKRCAELEELLDNAVSCNQQLLEKLEIARFVPDVLTKKIRTLQRELDKKDGCEMFDDLYIDRG